MVSSIKSVQRVSFHRNGVAGSSFYTVEFTMQEGRTTQAMLGIVGNWSREVSGHGDTGNVCDS